MLSDLDHTRGCGYPFRTLDPPTDINPAAPSERDHWAVWTGSVDGAASSLLNAGPYNWTRFKLRRLCLLTTHGSLVFSKSPERYKLK